MTRLDIAEQLLGCPLEDGIYAPCPGKDLHTTGNGRKDFRVVLDGAPTAYCFHGKCADEVAAFNKELRRRIWFAENGHQPAPRNHWGEGVAPAPKEETPARPHLDMQRVTDFTHGVEEVDETYLRRRSPVDVQSAECGDFLNQLYREGERVLVFTSQHSQGDFLFVAGTGKLAGSWRIAAQRSVKAVRSALPKGGKDGIWFLVQPVTGKWAIKSDVKFDESGRHVEGLYTRRSQINVTVFRYYVLESDELPAETWLRVLASLTMPISAIYTSGKRSIHALVKVEFADKASWDATRNQLRQIVCPLGADPAALSAVRLSRLPGCMRGVRKQELLYLNPDADFVPIRLMPEVRA